MTSSSSIPSLETTYSAGATVLKLYKCKAPDPPPDGDCSYKEGERLMSSVTDLFSTSVSRRLHISSKSPDVSITLKSRISRSHNRLPHVWTAQVQPNPESTIPSIPELVVAKIFDPVYISEEDRDSLDSPFSVRDLCVWKEVTAYQMLESLQGKTVPRFYGHFIASLGPSHQHRTVNVLLLEYIQGKDLCGIVPPDEESVAKICGEHLDGLITAVLKCHISLCDLGVITLDNVPRNVLLRSPSERKPHCNQEECPLRFETGCNPDDIPLVMFDFEQVQFIEPAPSPEEDERLMSKKEYYKETWLLGYPI
ncbi:hypothetical protein VKT23_011163 [Stygiomarasmius scandens]|uniref:Protein kinase domain-containing protein n=1 Tax=Marasmiellus scandens TaxID=2682957 RepID=A0ABR1JCQ7_9AGAR